MFGYVKVRRGDLRIKEYEFYKAVYCGLCHHQKKLSRRLRYSLSYDMVMLSLIRMGVTNERACFAKKRCPIHPLKGCLTVANSKSLAYTASASAILLYEKLRDDINDERGFRRLGAKLMAKGAYKAMKHAPILPLADSVRAHLDDLTLCERAKSPSVYEGAEHFGKLLGEVFSYDNGEGFSDLTKNDLYEIGYRTGRFIYILDAYADRKEDKKEGKYNPFNESGSDTESDAFKSKLITALDMEMVAASAALDRLALEDGGIHAILENLLKLGLGDTARSVIHDNKTLTLIEKESEKIK